MPSPSDYPRLREAVEPRIARMPSEQFEAVMEQNNIDAAAMEGWLSTLGSVAQTVLPIAGTVVGSVYGGPAGGAIGGQLGKLAGGAIGSATGQPAPAAPAPSPQRMMPPLAGPVPQAPSTPASPSVGMSAAGGSPAAGQLLQTLVRPETMQALMSMFMGKLGNPNVQVGGTQVPVGAFTNLLGVLAGKAASEYSEATIAARNAVPEYMQDYAGETVGDPAVAEHRARALSELLERTEIEQESSESSESAEAYGESAEYAESVSEMEALEREYDEMELLELSETDA